MTALQVVEHERESLVRFARLFTHNTEDAEDAVQAASLVALRRTDVTGPTAKAWLMAVIRNHIRGTRRASTLPLFSADGVPAVTVDVDALLDARDALAACRPDERMALLSRAAGWSYDELAEHNDWTYTKANRCITEGRARMRALVAA